MEILIILVFLLCDILPLFFPLAYILAFSEPIIIKLVNTANAWSFLYYS